MYSLYGLMGFWHSCSGLDYVDQPLLGAGLVLGNWYSGSTGTDGKLHDFRVSQQPM